MSKLNLKIENVREQFFNDDKETYLKFRKAWSDYYQNNKCSLSATDFLLYSMLRGRDPYECFSPLVNEGHINARLDFCGKRPDPYCALNSALSRIRFAVRESQNNHSRYMDTLLLPYGEIITKKHVIIVCEKISDALR